MIIKKICRKKKIIVTILCIIAVNLIIYLSLFHQTDKKISVISGNLENSNAIPTVDTKETYRYLYPPDSRYYGWYWGLTTGEYIPDSKIIGDVNLDGYVSLIDQYYIYQAMTQQRTLTEQAKINADVNGNGSINEDDAQCIFNFVYYYSGDMGHITAPRYNLFYTNKTITLKIEEFRNTTWEPAYTTDGRVWNSSDRDIATVDNGTVTINKPRFFLYICL